MIIAYRDRVLCPPEGVFVRRFTRSNTNFVSIADCRQAVVVIVLVKFYCTSWFGLFAQIQHQDCLLPSKINKQGSSIKAQTSLGAAFVAREHSPPSQFGVAIDGSLTN